LIEEIIDGDPTILLKKVDALEELWLADKHKAE
jgi:hypothetical protein